MLRFKISLLFFAGVVGMVGCKENKEALQTAYNKYHFDNNVIQKLSLYDSLLFAIYKSQPILKQYAAQDGGTHGFRYMPSSTDGEVYKKLPPEVEATIGAAYQQLGERYITGFDLFPDSSVRVYIRRNSIPTSSINIDEYLSFFPPGKNMRKRNFPEKDTTLTAHWQYWARVNDEGIF